MFQIRSRDFAPVNHGMWRPLFRQLDDLFEPPAAREVRGPSRAELDLPYDIEEADGHFVLSFDVPGVSRDDLSIELTGSRLLVTGERKAEGQNSRRRCGKFQRAFTLPEGTSAEAITAELKDGVLRLFIQKPVAAQPTRIKIAQSTSTPGSTKSDKKIKGGADVESSGENVETLAAASQG
jgi:HSP20 family protein